MVLAERHSELLRNGRRSRGPSPNGHNGASPDTSSDEDNSVKRNGKNKTKQSEYEEKIRVGRDYQAVCPDLIPAPDRKPELLNDRALLVWSPTKEIPDTKLEEYISVAKEKYGYNGEQALGMLFWHKHDLERAVMDLANFTPFPDEWTVEDKVLFEQAFQFHGKSFHRIRQMLPDKSIASLVKYYYSWKKTRHRQSVMDRQEKTKASKDGSENGSENGSNEESENDDKDVTTTASPSRESKNPNNNNSTSIGATSTSLSTSGPSNVINSENNGEAITNNSSNGKEGSCTGCGVLCNFLASTTQEKLCNSCHHHWRRTGTKRPTNGPYFNKRFRDRSDKQKRKPPKGMHINHDDICSLASSNDNQNDLLSNADREIVSYLSQVQNNKQLISSLKTKISKIGNDQHQIDMINRINSRWSNDEMQIAVHGIRKFGKDFQAIAEILGTKTEGHVRSFFANHRKRLNLDTVLKEFESEREKNQIPLKENEENKQLDVSKNCDFPADGLETTPTSKEMETEDKNLFLTSNSENTNDEQITEQNKPIEKGVGELNSVSIAENF